MATKKTNPVLVDLIRDLRKRSWDHDAPIWRDVARRLEKPARVWSEVNVSLLDRNVEEGQEAVVPGKVLGAGTIGHPITVAAFAFSRSAREKVESAGGECLRIDELADRSPTGRNLRIIG